MRRSKKSLGGSPKMKRKATERNHYSERQRNRRFKNRIREIAIATSSNSSFSEIGF